VFKPAEFPLLRTAPEVRVEAVCKHVTPTGVKPTDIWLVKEDLHAQSSNKDSSAGRGAHGAGRSRSASITCAQL
jgi:hypothetical protein